MSHSREDEAVATEAVDTGTLLAENASLRDRLLRALAEVENTQRRAERTAKDGRQFGIADFARELVVVADNLQRTIAAAEARRPDVVEDAGLIEGVLATQRVLMHILERFGVRKVDAVGKPFDPSLHEAIMETDDPSLPPGTVVSVNEDGYTIHERLLRPARVVVSKRRPQVASDSNEHARDSDVSSDPPDHRQ